VSDEHCVSVPVQVEVVHWQPSWLVHDVWLVIEAHGEIVPEHVVVEAFHVQPVAVVQYDCNPLKVLHVYNGAPVQLEVDVPVVQPGQ
jgi:hypothetical protein